MDFLGNDHFALKGVDSRNWNELLSSMVTKILSLKHDTYLKHFQQVSRDHGEFIGVVSFLAHKLCENTLKSVFSALFELVPVNFIFLNNQLWSQV